jgi:adenosylcobinamide-GDP ribazoletransferase
MKTASVWADLTRDVRIAVLICTRLPLGSSAEIGSLDLVRASWALPVAGALVAAAGALSFYVASELRLPVTIAAAIALAAMLLMTGGLHEDGLADTADGFGGGWDRERKLAIMHDSRLGTYGACAVVMSLLLRWAALSAIPGPEAVAAALMGAHVAARAALPGFMHVIPPARADGLSSQAGQPAWRSAAVAALIGTLALVLTLGFQATAVCLGLSTVAGFVMAWLCLRQIGGQTGDVLGALEQVIETVILLIAVAMWANAPALR